MKQVLFSALIAAFLFSSCSKSNEQSSVIPQTPLEKAIDKKYIQTGAADNSLEVDYAAYNSNQDCDKAVFDAAIETVTKTGTTNKVIVRGSNLTMTFDRGSSNNPTYSLTTFSSLYAATHKDWPYRGFIRITKQNTLLTTDQFDKAINVKVQATNTGDVAQIVGKNIASDLMTVEYVLSKYNAAYSRAMTYDIQAATPVTIRSQVIINCLIPGFIDTQSDVTLNISASLPGLTETNLGSGVISYKHELNPTSVSKTLSEYIAGRYFSEKVYPIVK